MSITFCPECGIGLSNPEKIVGYCKNCHCDLSEPYPYFSNMKKKKYIYKNHPQHPNTFEFVNEPDGYIIDGLFYKDKNAVWETIANIFTNNYAEIITNADHGTARQEHYAFFKAGFYASQKAEQNPEDKIQKAIEWVKAEMEDYEQETDLGARIAFENTLEMLQMLQKTADKP